MKGYTILLVLAVVGSGTKSSAPPDTSLKTFTLEELVPLQREFYPERVSVEWISDTEYLIAEPTIIRKYDANADEIVTVLDETALANFSHFSVSSFSSDQQYLVVSSNRKKVYRHSSLAEYSVYDLKNKSISKLDDQRLQVVIWGGKHSLAYVKDNNIYYVPDIANIDVVHTLTTEGVPGEIYYGATDWINEEEILNSGEAMWFSINGTYLAAISYNDTNVDLITYPLYGSPSDLENQYPDMVQIKYPKAGRTNPTLQVLVFKLDEHNKTAWTVPAPVDRVGEDFIVGNIQWASDHNVIIMWLNRRQNINIMTNCDTKKNECNFLKEENEPDGWIDIHEPIFNENGTEMMKIEILEHMGRRYSHVGRYNFEKQVTEDLSPVNATVTQILGWNQKSDTVYYIAAPRNLPWQRQIWSTTQGVVRCVTCALPSCHYADGMFSPGASFGIVSCSATNIPPSTYLISDEKQTFRLMTNNSELYERLRRYKLPMPLFNIISLEDDNSTIANINLMLPPDMEKDKKYPMIVKVYSGPGSTRVKDNYDLEYYNTYLAGNRSFIVASIDVRGSGVIDIETLQAVNNVLGTVEITDTLAAIRRLLNLYSFIDPERVGVWGWSYGGYATTMMLIQDDANMIACGAAVAPVTSWLYYDSMYTERYMDVPQNNLEGYKQSDLLLVAEKLRGRKYLLVHGTGDDNVHFQHSMLLAKVLQHADIEFQQVSYTDENHSLWSVSRHFYHTLDRFWTECFKL